MDYSEYALTSHGEMLLALVQSGISSYPHWTVAMQFFETTARYGDFFKIRKECIIPTLEAMVDQRYVVLNLLYLRHLSLNLLLGACTIPILVSARGYSTYSTVLSKKPGTTLLSTLL